MQQLTKLEQDVTVNMEIEVSKEVAAKTISWANYGWHTVYVGTDGTHYTWLQGCGVKVNLHENINPR